MLTTKHRDERRTDPRERGSRYRTLWLSYLLLGCVTRISAQETLLYVPFVNVHAGSLTLADGSTVGQRWLSTLTLFNNGSTAASWRWVAAYGGGVQLGGDGSDPYCMTSTAHDVSRGTGTSVGGCLGTQPTGGLAMVVLATTGSLLPNATVSRVRTVIGCQGPGELHIPQGRVPIPTFTSLFPAGSTVIAGEIDLGDTGFGSCATQNQRYPRRVNVTMFNAGDVEASFLIAVREGVNTPHTYYHQTVSIPAHEIVQVNSLPLNLDDIARQPSTRTDGGTIIWILITADQPYLSYVSTVFDDGEPGAMPMEVYPMHLGS